MLAAADHSAGAALRRRDGRIVRQRRVVQEGVGDVQAKAVHAALQPQIQHFQRRFARASAFIQFSLGCWRRNLWW